MLGIKKIYQIASLWHDGCDIGFVETLKFNRFAFVLRICEMGTIVGMGFAKYERENSIRLREASQRQRINKEEKTK